MKAKASNVPARYWSADGDKYRSLNDHDDSVTVVGRDVRAQVRVPHSQGYATYRIDLDLERLLDLVSWHHSGRAAILDVAAQLERRNPALLSEFHVLLMKEAMCRKCSASLNEPCRNLRTQAPLEEPHSERGGSWVREQIKRRLQA